jgi:uncharacterized protein YndB with AHSA1/START domain
MKINAELDLKFERIIDVPRHLVWEAWTTPEQIKIWFTPAPWRTTECEIDLKPGGKFRTLMKGPAGEENDMAGCYLEIVKNEKLIWTDALLPGFRPSANGFFTAMIMLEDHNGGTKYTAYALHKDAAGRKMHQEMGFEHGWGLALDQLVAMIKSRK